MKNINVCQVMRVIGICIILAVIIESIQYNSSIVDFDMLHYYLASITAIMGMFMICLGIRWDKNN